MANTQENTVQYIVLIYNSLELQRCDNEECLAALETRPYLIVRHLRHLRQLRNLCHIFEIFCIYCN